MIKFLTFIHLCVLVFQAPLWAVKIEVLLFDVGQGKCALVHKQGEPPLIIDAGTSGSRATYASVGRRISERIQAVGNQAHIIISHGHNDHLSLLPTITALQRAGPQAPPCKVLFFVGGEPGHYKEPYKSLVESFRKTAQALYASEITEEIPYPDFSSLDETMKVEFLSTTVGRGENASNDSSLITKVTFHNKSIVFTGDATGRTTADISGIVAKADVFDPDHHGSNEKGSNNLSWVCKVAPQYAIFSAQKNSQY